LRDPGKDRAHPPQELGDVLLFLVNRNHDAEEHGIGLSGHARESALILRRGGKLRHERSAGPGVGPQGAGGGSSKSSKMPFTSDASHVVPPIGLPPRKTFRSANG